MSGEPRCRLCALITLRAVHSDLEFAAPRDADLPDEGRAYVEHVTTPDSLRERSGGSQTSSELAMARLAAWSRCPGGPTAWRCHSLPLALRSRSRLGRDLQAKERGNEGEKLDARQLRELVRLLERSTDTARRAVEVGERKGHGPGHGELEAPNGRSWQWLRQRVGGLVASRAVHEPDGALVNHLVAKAVVARVDVSGLAAVREHVRTELDACLVVLEERGGCQCRR